MVKMGIDGMFIPFFDFRNTEGYILRTIDVCHSGLDPESSDFLT